MGARRALPGGLRQLDVMTQLVVPPPQKQLSPQPRHLAGKATLLANFHTYVDALQPCTHRQGIIHTSVRL